MTGNRDLRLYLVGQTASVFGSTLTSTATSVVAVTQLHAGPREVSYIVLSGTLPALLLGPLCGALVDRVTRPRRVLLGTDAACLAALAACGAAGLAGRLSTALLCMLAFALGLAQLVVGGLYFSHLRSLQVTDLGRARGRLQSGEMLSRSLAAAAAGPLAAAVGAAVLFLGDALSYLLSAACLAALRAPDRREVAPATRGSLLHSVRCGFTMLRGHPLLAAYLPFSFLCNTATSGVSTQRSVFLLDTLRLPVAAYTLPTMVATAVGATGALLAPRVLARVPAPRLLVASLAGAGVSAAVLPLAGGPLAVELTVVIAATALPIFFGTASNLALVTVLSDDIGDAYFGRVTTLLGSNATLASAIGAILGGALGTRFGTRTGIWICEAIGIAAVAVLASRAGRRRPAAAERVRVGSPLVAPGVGS